jgi:hypothetical protein
MQGCAHRLEPVPVARPSGNVLAMFDLLPRVCYSTVLPSGTIYLLGETYEGSKRLGSRCVFFLLLVDRDVCVVADNIQIFLTA